MERTPGFSSECILLFVRCRTHVHDEAEYRRDNENHQAYCRTYAVIVFVDGHTVQPVDEQIGVAGKEVPLACNVASKEEKHSEVVEITDELTDEYGRCGKYHKGQGDFFELLLKRLNIPHKGFHSLRHTFATRALECGMDVKTLSEILGHKNPTVTLNRYAHSLMEHKADMMNRLGKLL